jgi:predicted phage terminase large subunit-like protein
MVTAPSYKVLRDSTLQSFEETARHAGQLIQLLKGDSINALIRTDDGGIAKILFRSTDNPELLRGPNLSGVWMDEASLSHFDAYKILIARLREGGKVGWLGATFTPKGLGHWSFEVFGQARPGVFLVQAHTAENPFLSDEFLELVQKTYVGLQAAQELEGQFVSIEGAEWPGEYFHDGIWFSDWPRDMHIKVIALDPSKGKDAKAVTDKRAADYSAFVFAGLDGDGTIWVDADLNNRRSAEQIVQDALVHCRTWQPTAFVIETNNFQELFEPLLKRAFDEAHIPLPGYKVNNYVNKQVRIRSLGPILAGVDGRFRFRANSPGCKLLVQQLRDFPVGQYDDGPDALEQAVRVIRFLLWGKCDMGTPQLLTV